MARGYKLVDDPLEGILGNVLKLQQLQEGYEQGEQRKQDRYFNKLSSFQQNLTANLTDRNAMEMNLKVSQSFYDKNKGDMDSNMIGAFQDYTKMVNDKISAHADANIAYQQYNSFQDGMFGLTDDDKDPETPEVAGGFFNKIENVDDEQTWKTPDETGKTLAEQAGEKLATFADLERRVAEGLEYLSPSQQRYFQKETDNMQNVNNAIIYELSDKGLLTEQDIDLLNTNPQEFLNLNQTKIDIRRKDQVEFNNQVNSIQYAQSGFKAAEKTGGSWIIGTGKDAEEFNLSDTKDDSTTGMKAALAKYHSLENQKQVLTNAFNTKYAYTPLIGEPVKPVADPKDVDPKDVDQGKPEEGPETPTPAYRQGEKLFVDSQRQKNYQDVRRNQYLKNTAKTGFLAGSRNLKGRLLEENKTKKSKYVNVMFVDITENIAKSGKNPKNMSREEIEGYINNWIDSKGKTAKQIAGFGTSARLQEDLVESMDALIDSYIGYSDKFATTDLSTQDRQRKKNSSHYKQQMRELEHYRKDKNARDYNRTLKDLKESNYITDEEYESMLIKRKSS